MEKFGESILKRRDEKSGIEHENNTRGEKVNKDYSSASMLENIIPALQAIHKEGVAHNDMHEGNILIGPDAQTKLIEFGNAQTKEGERRKWCRK